MMEDTTESVRQNAGYIILQTEKIGKLEIGWGKIRTHRPLM